MKRDSSLRGSSVPFIIGSVDSTSEHWAAEALDKGLRENGLSYLLFLRLVPLFPFWLINLTSGITGLPLRTYVIGTMFGIMPGSFVFANAGASLATIDSLSGVASPRVVGSFVLLGLFALVPTVYQKIRKARESGD